MISFRAIALSLLFGLLAGAAPVQRDATSADSDVTPHHHRVGTASMQYSFFETPAATADKMILNARARTLGHRDVIKSQNTAIKTRTQANTYWKEVQSSVNTLPEDLDKAQQHIETNTEMINVHRFVLALHTQDPEDPKKKRPKAEDSRDQAKKSSKAARASRDQAKALLVLGRKQARALLAQSMKERKARRKQAREERKASEQKAEG